MIFILKNNTVLPKEASDCLVVRVVASITAGQEVSDSNLGSDRLLLGSFPGKWQ